MGQVVAAVASASPCGHRAVEARTSLRQQQREARIQASKEEFSSDEDEDGIWKAWGASGELTMEDGKLFSSGTEAEQDGRDFETAMRDLLALEEGHLELRNIQASVEALQKAHKRLPRDLASLQCTRTLPNEPKRCQMRSQVDGAGTIKWQILDRCDWIVRPSSIDGDRPSNVTGPFCVVEMSINTKPFALKIYQLGKIAFMLSQGAKWRGKTTEVDKLFYIVITNRGKPILQADKLLRRYSALNEAHADGRFGVIHVSWSFVAKSFELGGATSTTVGAYALFFSFYHFSCLTHENSSLVLQGIFLALRGSAQSQTKQVWVRQLRKDCTLQHTCHSSSVDCFLACIGTRSCSRRCPSISSHPKSCVRVDAFLSIA